MNLMEQAPEEICNKIDAMCKRFLKSCGYKLVNCKDNRQCNRIINRMKRNEKELTYRQITAKDGSIYFWFELVEAGNHEKVSRKSEILHFTFNKMDYNANDQSEQIEVDPMILERMIKEGV